MPMRLSEQAQSWRCGGMGSQCARMRGLSWAGWRGVGASFPPLAGQSSEYLSAQLDAWRRGTRKNDPQALMPAISPAPRAMTRSGRCPNTSPALVNGGATMNGKPEACPARCVRRHPVLAAGVAMDDQSQLTPKPAATANSTRFQPPTRGRSSGQRLRQTGTRGPRDLRRYPDACSGNVGNGMNYQLPP